MLALHHASRALQRLLLAQARASGLGLLEILVLSRASEGDGVSPGEVGRSLGLSTSTMTGVSDRLERAKLIRRHPHPTDGRLLLLKATSKGQRIRERTLGPIFADLTRQAATATDDERAAACRILDQVAALVNQHAEALSRAPRGPGGRASGPRRTRAASTGRTRSQKDHTPDP